MDRNGGGFGDWDELTGQPKGSWGGFGFCSPPHVIIFESTCSRAVWRILSRLCETEGSLRLSRIISMSLAARPADLASDAPSTVPPSDEKLGRGLKMVPLLISSSKSFPSPPELELPLGLAALSSATEEAGPRPPPPLAGGIGEAASLSILLGLNILPAIAAAGRLQAQLNPFLYLPDWMRLDGADCPHFFDAPFGLFFSDPNFWELTKQRCLLGPDPWRHSSPPFHQTAARKVYASG